MARFTLSVADDVAAQLDAYAAANNLNRSQAAEHISPSSLRATRSPPERMKEKTSWLPLLS